MTVLSAVGVGKRYRTAGRSGPRTLRRILEREPIVERWALREIDISVAAGETLGLIGANGSGKSTLLRVLAGITRPTDGRVSRSGSVGTVLSLGDTFHPLLTGYENALTGAIVAGATRRDAARRIAAIAEFAGLGTAMDQPLRTLSDGQRLRLAFAVAVHVAPDLLFVDEILSVGDLAFRERCLDHMDHLRRRGITIVVASHDLSQIRRMCDTVAWLDGGRVRELGAPDEVTDAYTAAMQAQRADHRQSRKGSGEIEIRQVTVHDRAGRPIVLVDPGTPVTVAIDYVAHRPIEGAVFGVSMHATGGERCLDLNRPIARTLSGTGTIELQLDRLDVAGGAYTLAAGVFTDEWRPYDYWWRAAALEIAGDRNPALLVPPHRWSPV